MQLIQQNKDKVTFEQDEQTNTIFDTTNKKDKIEVATQIIKYTDELKEIYKLDIKLNHNQTIEKIAEMKKDSDTKITKLQAKYQLQKIKDLENLDKTKKDKENVQNTQIQT